MFRFICPCRGDGTFGGRLDDAFIPPDITLAIDVDAVPPAAAAAVDADDVVLVASLRRDVLLVLIQVDTSARTTDESLCACSTF